MSGDDYLAEFQFMKQRLLRLEHILQLPHEFRCKLSKNFNISFTDAFFILLKILAYPSCYSYMIHKFGRAVSTLFIVSNQILNILDNGSKI